MRPVLWFSMLQEQHQAHTDLNRSYGIPRATFATAINLEPLPMHWATELSHPRENKVILGPGALSLLSQTALKPRAPGRTHLWPHPELRAFEQVAFFSQPREPTMSFYSMANIGHCYCTQRRDLVKLPRRTSHSHCECFLLV